MWLIRAKDYKLVYFLNENRPKYAILSHRWDDQYPEVSFQDMKDIESARLMPNFSKIRSTCTQALKDGYEYVWIDTCCINKDSSAELSEAINSMFKWYQGSAVCYASLKDVECTIADDEFQEQFSQSEWFERGWTLQELIAPRNVIFYNEDWTILGNKLTLKSSISTITGIDMDILQGKESFKSRSIAQRMSWASNRITTRTEDMAYSLLGIFDVNMPMLYGEGEKAFIRLQEEIIKNSDDHTIFTWNITPTEQFIPLETSTTRQNEFKNLYGLLATTPSGFHNHRYMESRESSPKGRPPFTITNRGLSIELPARLIAMDTYIVFLQCHHMPKGEVDHYPYGTGLFITRLHEDDQFARVSIGQRSVVFGLHPSGFQVQPSRPNIPVGNLQINVRQQASQFWNMQHTNDDYNRRRMIDGFRITGDSNTYGLELDVSRHRAWNYTRSTVVCRHPMYTLHDGSFGPFGKGVVLTSTSQTSKLKWIYLTFDFDCNPICLIATNQGELSACKTDIQNLYESSDAKTIWSKCVKDKFGYEIMAEPSSIHPFVWVLKGDRIQGQYAQLVSGKEREHVANIRLTRLRTSAREWAGMMIWDLYLTFKLDARQLAMLEMNDSD